MPFIKKNNVDFKIIDNCIKLTPDYITSNAKKFKKITGSRFASVLGINKYTTPVLTWAIMVGIYKELMDPILSNAGNVIEPKIRDYVSNKLNINFISYDPIKINWDVFTDNSIFGGIPDGEPIDSNGKLLYPNAPMLEIKTSSTDSLVYKNINSELKMILGNDGLPIAKKINGKKEQWFIDGKINVSDEYKMQLGLYLYLRNINKGIFAICFLEREDYIFPEKCDIKNRDIKLVELNLKREKILPFIKQAEIWYQQHILTGVSPQLSESDMMWLKREI